MGLVLFSAMDAMVRPPEAGIDEAVPRDTFEALIRNQADLERRRATETAVLAPQVRAAEIQEQRAAPVVLAPPGVMLRRPQGVIVLEALSDEQIEAWVFQPHGIAARARDQLVSELALRIVEIDRACDLTYAQKRKLRLAGRGDIKRFFDRFEAVKQKLRSMQNDKPMVQQIFAQYIIPLQTAFQAGLFHEKSLLVKSLHTTLTSEQLARYKPVAPKAGPLSDEDDRAEGPDERVAPVKE
jgi:hypothetical protein